MRKIYKAAAGLLVAGVLLSGIGSGIAFAEYSRFVYGGSRNLEGSRYIEKTVSIPIDFRNQDKEQESRTVYLECRYPFRVERDASVAKGCVRADIQYLTDDSDVRPEFIQETLETEEESGSVFLFLDCGYQGNDMRDILRAKDIFLENIKEKRLSDYHWDGVKEVVIRVNPESGFEVECVVY